MAAPDDAIAFVAGGMNESDAEDFKALVDESLKDAAENGFSQEMVDSVMVSLEILDRLSAENAEPWDGVVNSVAYDYVVTGNPFEYSELVEALSGMEEENRQGLLKEACAKWLTDSALYTLTTTYPAPGEKEKADAALAEKLAEIKAGMSAEELEAIVAETKAIALEEESAEEADNGEGIITSELIAKIKVLNSQELPEEIRIYPVSDETDENGIRHIDVTAGVDGIGQVQLLLDAAALPQEDIHWMRLYTRLLGQLDTEDHTRDELDVLTARYLNSQVIGVNALELQDSVHPYVCVEWIALDDDLAAGYDLAEELLFRTKFDDTQIIADRIDAQISAVRNTINQNAYQVMWYRGMADRYPFYQYYTYLNFMDYYAFLLQLEEQIAADPEGVTEHFLKLQSFFANNAGAITAFAGSEESAALNRPLADAFMAKLGHEEREAAVYDLPVPATREALIIDGNVQFNMVIGTADDLGLEGFDAGLNAVSQVISDLLLIPVLRDEMGVYQPFTGFVDNGSLYLITYLDPNLRDTFDFYAILPELIEKIDVTQEVLDGYIQSIFAVYATPEGELSGATSAVQTVLEGRSQEEKLEYMRQLKAMTPDTVETIAELYRKAWENGVHSTAGSAAAISEAAELFDVILNPFSVEETPRAEMTDVPEDHEYYAGIRFALDNGLMRLKKDGVFAPDEAATVGDYLGALNVLFGLGGNDPEAAKETFLQYQLITPKTNIAAELHEDFLCKLLNDATGQTILTTDTPDAAVPRGDLADLLYQLSGGAGE